MLTGEGMQALGLHILAQGEVVDADAANRLKMVETLAHAASSRGMAGGQAIDLNSVGKELNLAELEDMHIHKTGTLIRASVIMAAFAKDSVAESTLAKLDHYAKCIGLAFQIHDDILDVEGDTQTLGKPQGSDSQQNKPTYPALLGLNQAKARATALHDEAIQSLAGFDEGAELLRQIATYIVKRVK